VKVGERSSNLQAGLTGGGGEQALTALREHLGELQLPQVVHRRRAIILFEGPQGAGKKHALKQLAASFDPCHYAVHCILHDRREGSEGHWLARFWRQLPPAGDTAIFFRSWYRRVLDDRILGRIDEKTVARAFDEINEFEAQQRDYGTLIVKLFFEVDADVQEARLAQRAENPWMRVAPAEDPISVRDTAYLEAAFRHALVSVADDRRQRCGICRGCSIVRDRGRLGGRHACRAAAHRGEIDPGGLTGARIPD
jgi:hypothetical protein